MVFRHFTNMIGEITDEKSEVNTKKRETNEDLFLSELATHVDKSGKMSGNIHERSDNLGRIAGFGIGVGSLCLQEALGYPFIVLRRQCQVNQGALKYHILPFSLFRVIGRIHHRQGATVFWKGWGSSCIVKGVSILTEVATCELLSVPRRKQYGEGKSLKYELIREILKGCSFILTLPLLSTSLIDTVQSLALGQSRSVFAFFKDSFERIVGWYVSRGHGRLLPLHHLIIPSIIYGVASYALRSFLSRSLVRPIAKRYQISYTMNEKNMKKIYYAELLSNLLSSLITDVLMYPLETVVIRLHLQGTRTIIDDTDKGIGVVPLCTNYDGMIDCFDSVIRQEGPGGLYKGFGALLIQYTIQFLVVKLAKPLYCSIE